MFYKLIIKIRRKLLCFFCKPIRVFCFHQVSDVFEPETMWECDWTQTEVFKKKILALKEKYTFVSLTEAYNHISNDKIRLKNYAALTADDGWASLKNVIPWLAEQRIPVTLFLNPLYLDGKHYQSRETEKLLTCADVNLLTKMNPHLISIASHGWEHKDCSKMDKEEFLRNVQKAEDSLKDIKCKVPFYAFTYGKYIREQVDYLKRLSLVPVLIDGTLNTNNSKCIHRECIDKGYKIKREWKTNTILSFF